MVSLCKDDWLVGGKGVEVDGEGEYGEMEAIAILCLTCALHCI